MAKEKEEKKSSSSSSEEPQDKEKSSSEEETGKKSSSDDSGSSSSSGKEEKSSSSEEKGSSSSEDKDKKSSSSSEDKKKGSSSSSGSSSEDANKLVTIDVDKYKPRAPSTPVPAGAEDCFGKYRDPETIECTKCLEAENCGAVMNSKLKEEGKKMSKKDKEKKAKKSSSSSEDKKKSSSASASSDDKKKKKSSSEEPKSPISELVTGIIAESKAEKKGFKVKMGRSRVVVLSGKTRILKITKANTDKPAVQLKTRYEPEAFGLKDKYWKNKKFTGNLSKLGGYLETYFSNFEKAGKESKKKKSSSD